MLMSPDNGAVDHHVFIVMIGGQITKYPLDHTTFTPAAQTPMHIFSVPETGGEVTPRDACTVTIQHSFHKKPVVRSRTANMTFPAG